MTAKATATRWYELFSRRAADLYPNRSSAEHCLALPEQAEVVERLICSAGNRRFAGVGRPSGRLRSHGLRARTVELKVRSSDFRTRTRSLSLADATDVTDVLWQAAKVLFERTLTAELLPVRLLGVGGTRLTTNGTIQGDLFDSGVRERQTSLDRAVDAIRSQFGAAATRRRCAVDKR
jgi:hypothetical protein